MIRSISAADLTRLSEQALAEGGELLEQLPAAVARAAASPIRLAPRREFEHSATAFFDEVVIDGRKRSLMGCRHRLVIAAKDAPADRTALEQFAFRELLSQAETFDLGRPGGFRVHQVVGADADQTQVAPGPLGWDAFEAGEPWRTLSIELHDFELRLGPARLRPRQVVYVVQHPRFIGASPTTATVAYPFVPFAPLPNPFGFGPGKFGAAVKQYAFELRAGGELQVEMIFAAAPRCEKVLDLAGLPDPVFGLLGLMEVLTLGRLPAAAGRQGLETSMLETHCNVHAAFLAGFARRWQAS